MNSPISNPRRMGALPGKNGTDFRVWAPNAERVSVVGEFNDWSPGRHPLEREDGGLWFLTVPEAKPGHQYQYEIVNGDKKQRKNDAYVRDLHPEKKTSIIYDGDAFAWKAAPFVLAKWNELVLYELHVGNFAAGPGGGPGTFDNVIKRLPYLKGLGINALELMPPMSFPSERSWGYNLTSPFAVESSYGGPDGLKRLVDAAHALGIAIILDVVINHFGPDDLDLWQYDGWSENDKGGIYFYNDHRAWTPWGENRPDFGRGEVRQYLRDSVLIWLDEFHCDGLRFDATLFIRNTRGENNQPQTDIAEGWTLMQWINDEVERFFPGRISIAEDLQQNEWITKPTKEGGLGYHSQWDSAFVYTLRGSVIEIEDDHRSMEKIAGIIPFRFNEDAIQRLIYSESHDSVANGQARIPQEIDPADTNGFFARKRSTLAAGLTLTSPGIPMLFEGQEFLETGWFQDSVAIDWSKLDTFKGINRLYRDLVHLRRNLYGNTRGLTGPFVRMTHLNDEAKIIAYHRWMLGGPKDDVVVVASFVNRDIEHTYRIGFPHNGRWFMRFNSDWKGYSPDFHDVGLEKKFIETERQEHDEFPYSAVVNLPSYGLVIFSQDEAGPKDALELADEERAGGIAPQ